MNYFNPYPLVSDESIITAWDSQVARSADAPWLAEAITQVGSEVFPRFAVCYAQLRALPRGARRALQRQLARSQDLATILPVWLPGQAGHALQRKLARSLAGAALLLALGQGVAQAYTINVSPKTPPGVNPGDLKCSLIEAIINANDTVTGQPYTDCAAGDPYGADTIVLPKKSAQTLTSADGFYYGPTGLPLITSQITIVGNRSKITRSNTASPFRLMAVTYTGSLTLQGVTLSGGAAGPYYDGGAVLNRNGALTISGSTISGNTANFGGGVHSYQGTLTISNSTITGNSANAGGGVYNVDGILTITGGTISKNVATTSADDGRGGGVFNRDTMTPHPHGASISGTKITGNQAKRGGGVFNSSYYSDSYYGSSSLSINNSTISKNTAVVANSSGGNGGGVYNYSPPSYYSSYSSRLFISGGTITGNKANNNGGGVANTGYFSFSSGSITKNTANNNGGGVANTGYFSFPSGSITKNTATNYGGGVYNSGAYYFAPPGGTITGNKAKAGANTFP